MPQRLRGTGCSGVGGMRPPAHRAAGPFAKFVFGAGWGRRPGFTGPCAPARRPKFRARLEPAGPANLMGMSLVFLGLAIAALWINLLGAGLAARRFVGDYPVARVTGVLARLPRLLLPGAFCRLGAPPAAPSVHDAWSRSG